MFNVGRGDERTFLFLCNANIRTVLLRCAAVAYAVKCWDRERGLTGSKPSDRPALPIRGSCSSTVQTGLTHTKFSYFEFYFAMQECRWKFNRIYLGPCCTLLFALLVMQLKSY